MKLKRGQMITNSKGVSYYQKGNKYYSNTGWLEKEISKADFSQEQYEALNEFVTKAWLDNNPF